MVSQFYEGWMINCGSMSQVINRTRNRGLSKKWRNKVNKSVDIIQEFGHVKPTVRAILYQLDGVGLLNKSNKNHANDLSKHLVDARKEGLIDWDGLSDDARVVLGNVPEYMTADEYIQLGIDHIKGAHTNTIAIQDGTTNHIMSKCG